MGISGIGLRVVFGSHKSQLGLGLRLEVHGLENGNMYGIDSQLSR